MSLYATALAIYNALPIGKKQLPETRSLHIPDLFAGILSGDPERNLHEVEVGRKSEAWTKE
jgi:hypothetical protein